MAVEDAAGDGYWDVDVSSVPVVWVPAPGWPVPPRGWYPPEGWRPERGWPAAPRDWEFWQPDPEQLARERAWWWQRLCSTSLGRISTDRGLRLELNGVEHRLAARHRGNALLTRPHPLEVRAGSVLPSDDRRRLWCFGALADVTEHLGALRAYLLGVARGAVVASGEDYARLRLEDHRLRTSYLATGGDWISARVEAYATKVGPRERWGDEPDPVITLHRLLWREWLGDRADVSTGVEAWIAAEHEAARFVRGLGFRDAEVTEAGADAGLDVVGTGVVGQVKYLSSKVGRPDLQRLVGANTGGARMVFFSRSGYSADAVRFADEVRMALFTVELPGHFEAVNELATRLQRGAG